LQVRVDPCIATRISLGEEREIVTFGRGRFFASGLI